VAAALARTPALSLSCPALSCSVAAMRRLVAAVEIIVFAPSPTSREEMNFRTRAGRTGRIRRRRWCMVLLPGGGGEWDYGRSRPANANAAYFGFFNLMDLGRVVDRLRRRTAIISEGGGRWRWYRWSETGRTGRKGWRDT